MNHFARSLALLAACLPAAFTVPAAEPAAPSQPSAAEATAELPAVIVTATRSETSLLDAPLTVNEVTAEHITRGLIESFPDALRETPGVMVQKTSPGQGSPFIRGFTGFRNLLLVDGIRFNNSVFREGPNQYWNTIDPLSLDHIEVVKGQGSVLYGTDAIGGTVNAFSKSGARSGLAPGTAYVGGLASYRFASAEDSHIAHLEADIGKAGVYDFHLGGSLKQFGDIRAAGVGVQEHTGYDEWDIDAKFNWYLDDRWTLTGAYQRVQQDDVWRTHRTIYGTAWEGTAVGTELSHIFDQERQLGYLRLAGEDLDGFIQRSAITFSWQRMGEDRDRVSANRSSDIESFEVDTFGLNLELESETAIGLLTYGASYYHDEVDSFAQKFAADGSTKGPEIQGPVGDDSSYDLADAFIQDKITLGSRTDLYLGGRFSYAAADVGRAKNAATGKAFSFSDDWSTLVGSARVLQHVLKDDALNLYGGVAQGFRAPNLSDLSRFDIARSNELEVPSPSLEPEDFVNFELGLRSQLDRLEFGAAAFYTLIDGMIVRQPTGREIDGLVEVAKRNGGDGYLYGFELDAAWHPHPQWTLYGALAWTDGKVDAYPTSAPVSEVEYLSRMLPLTGQLGVRWESKSRNVWLELYSLAATEQDRLNSSDERDTQRIPPGGTPGYITLNVRGGWNVCENLTLTAALENLTDEEYRIHGSGSNEPGFNAVVGVTVRF